MKGLANWIMVIGWVVIGITLFAIGISLITRQIRTAQRQTILEEMQDFHNQLVSVCNMGLGNKKSYNLALPDNVRAVYVAKNDHELPPDKVSEMITNQNTDVGNYICIQFFDDNLPICQDVGCDVDLTYMGSPSMKSTLQTLIAQLKGNYPIYEYTVEMEKSDEYFINAIAEMGIKTIPQYPPQEDFSIKGLGICHYVPEFIKDDDVFDWAYETSRDRGVFWREIEPNDDEFEFTELDRFIESFEDSGVKIWLSIQTVSADLSGNPKAPTWMMDHWITADCKHGIFAPWDETYQNELSELLEAMNEHIQQKADENPKYRETIGGIMMMSGGMYGEMQLWSCEMENVLIQSLNLNPSDYGDVLDFRQEYFEAVSEIVDIYMSSFDESIPIAIQLGYNGELESREVGVDRAVVEDKVNKYGDRLILKWNGLDPRNVGDGLDEIRKKNVDYYVDLFNDFRGKTITGFEVGHPEYYHDSYGNWIDKRFEDALNAALDARACFVCFQQGKDGGNSDFVTGGLKGFEEYKNYDQSLERNCGWFSQSTTTTTSTTTTSPSASSSTTTTIILPSQWDWSHKILPNAPPLDGKDWMSRVKNQGLCGSCWAFSAVGAVEGTYNIEQDNADLDPDLSEQYLVSCSGVGDCSSGNRGYAIGYIRIYGITDESCFPYTATDADCDSNRCADWNTRLWIIDDTPLLPGNGYNVEEAKKILASHGPILGTVSIGGQLHGVVVVGYDDSNNEWIYKNSWGTGWGINGYNKINYNDMHIPGYYVKGVNAP